jgi:WD40 repeat protein
VRIWKLPSGEPVGEPLKHRGIVWQVEYSPNGERLVTASADRTAQIWDARSQLPLTQPLRHEQDVLSARFSPEGDRVLTAALDGTARVWDSSTGDLIGMPMSHLGATWLAKFSPDGRIIATGSLDHTARLWDATTGLPISGLLRHDSGVVRISFSPDGSSLLTADGRRARLWNVTRAPTPVPAWFCDLIDTVSGIRLDPDGRLAPTVPGAARELDQRLLNSGEQDFYSRWAREFLVERTTRVLHKPPAVKED